MRTVFGATTVAALLLAGCTQLMTTALPDELVDERYHGHLVNWTSGEQITFAYRVFDSGGSVGLCGAWAESPGGGVHQRTFNERSIQTHYLELGGEVLVNDISFFRKGRYVPDEAPEGTANCVRTDRPWRALYDRTRPEMQAARTRFVVYD